MSYVEELFNLKGQTAVVTGGAGGIGTEMSRALLKANANVIIWSRSRESIDEALEKLASVGSKNLKGIAVDTNVEADVETALSESISFFGQVDILINGVGGNIGKNDFVDTNLDQFNKVLQMNLVAGLMVPTKVFTKYWIDKGVKGSVINLTSMASYKPLSGVWAYNAAKAAVLNLTQGAATEFAKHGIRVNAIAPGFFIGKQNRDLLIDKDTGDYTERGKSVISRTPYKRFGDVTELAGATLFLASNAASGFVTGISIPVDGGYLVDNI